MSRIPNDPTNSPKTQTAALLFKPNDPRKPPHIGGGIIASSYGEPARGGIRIPRIWSKVVRTDPPNAGILSPRPLAPIQGIRLKK